MIHPARAPNASYARRIDCQRPSKLNRNIGIGGLKRSAKYLSLSNADLAYLSPYGIRKAVEELLEKETHSQEWSEAVLQWQGDPKFAPFESHRAKLAEPTQDPFG